jgi:hypothetical protein
MSSSFNSGGTTEELNAHLKEKEEFGQEILSLTIIKWSRG